MDKMAFTVQTWEATYININKSKENSLDGIRRLPPNPFLIWLSASLVPHCSLCVSPPCRPVRETLSVALVSAVPSVCGWEVWGCVSREAWRGTNATPSATRCVIVCVCMWGRSPIFPHHGLRHTRTHSVSRPRLFSELLEVGEVMIWPDIKALTGWLSFRKAADNCSSYWSPPPGAERSEPFITLIMWERQRLFLPTPHPSLNPDS